jgi:hypothetical protein
MARSGHLPVDNCASRHVVFLGYQTAERPAGRISSPSHRRGRRRTPSGRRDPRGSLSPAFRSREGLHGNAGRDPRRVRHGKNMTSGYSGRRSIMWLPSISSQTVSVEESLREAMVMIPCWIRGIRGGSQYAGCRLGYMSVWKIGVAALLQAGNRAVAMRDFRGERNDT